ncbi:hypothetical protein O5759_26790, partial [Escherichia coli]|nr:hypothetical protein [Escherichia coli]
PAAVKNEGEACAWLDSLTPEARKSGQRVAFLAGLALLKAIEARKTGFDEIYLPFRADQAQREASRCLKCGEHSVCEWTCPLHNHIPQ